MLFTTFLRRTLPLRSATSQGAIKKKINFWTGSVPNPNKARFRLWAPQLLDTGAAVIKKADLHALSKRALLAPRAVTTELRRLLLSWNQGPIESVRDTEHFIIPAFEEGRGVDMYRYTDKAIPVAVDRPQDERDLATLLRPQVASTYAVIIGHSRCGKSMLLRKVIRSLDGPKGAVYCNVPDVTKNFITDLREILGFKSLGAHSVKTWMAGGRDMHPHKIHQQANPYALWMEMRGPLLDAAREYRTKHGRAAVLVIDSADLLAREQPEVLSAMQDFAKTCAEQGVLRFIFVSSNGAALSLMQSRFTWSKHAELFEIGHLSDQQAENLLMQRGIPRKVAKVVVQQITGGWLHSLYEFLQIYNPSEPIENVLYDMDKRMSNAMQHLNFLAETAVFQEMASRPTMRMHQLNEYLHQTQIDNLIYHNILCVHPRGFYTFRSRHVAAFFERRFDEIKRETNAFVNFLVSCY